MKDTLRDLITQSVDQLVSEGVFSEAPEYKINVDATKDKSHGDFATNVAMVLSKKAGMPPRQLAEKLVETLLAQNHDAIEKVDIAGPGFINFFCSGASNFAVLNSIFEKGDKFGLSDVGAGKKVQVEFVSANPTGPLHVGHGRGAAYGATVADLLEAIGFDVDREYYVNDAGRQMNILATSIWLRYLQACGAEIRFPDNGYKGEYIHDIANAIKVDHSDAFVVDTDEVLANLPKDESEGGDKELYIDALIVKAKTLLGEHYKTVFDKGLDSIVDDIRDDLEGFGVSYQEWFSEASLSESIDDAIAVLQKNGHIYEDKGALWFRSTTFGDDKDRVVKRDNGDTTYFASDIAYHLNKFQRGYDKVINVWGADHHGYIARVKAALSALDLDPEKLEIRLVQFAHLYRGGEQVPMSTRSGSFVTLRELREEVGKDAARFFYVTRKAEQHMDFDLDLAKSESKDNPVYYIQYAHARICSMLEKAEFKASSEALQAGTDFLGKEAVDAEIELAKRLAKYPETLENSALNGDPHTLTHYLKDLASDFHTYYNSNKVLVDDDALRGARITMNLAVKQVIQNGLTLLGVSAPESM